MEMENTDDKNSTAINIVENEAPRNDSYSAIKKQKSFRESFRGEAVGNEQNETQINGQQDQQLMEHSPEQLKKEYLKNYSISFKIPSCNILDSKFYRKDPRFSFQLCKYDYPESGIVKLEQGKPEKKYAKEKRKNSQFFGEMFADKIKNQEQLFQEAPDKVIFNHEGSTPNMVRWDDVFKDEDRGIQLRLLYKQDPHSATRIVKRIKIPSAKIPSEIKKEQSFSSLDSQGEKTYEEYNAIHAELEVSEDSQYLAIYSQLESSQKKCICLNKHEEKDHECEKQNTYKQILKIFKIPEELSIQDKFNPKNLSNEDAKDLGMEEGAQMLRKMEKDLVKNVDKLLYQNIQQEKILEQVLLNIQNQKLESYFTYNFDNEPTFETKFLMEKFFFNPMSKSKDLNHEVILLQWKNKLQILNFSPNSKKFRPDPDNYDKEEKWINIQGFIKEFIINEKKHEEILCASFNWNQYNDTENFADNKCYVALKCKKQLKIDYMKLFDDTENMEYQAESSEDSMYDSQSDKELDKQFSQRQGNDSEKLEKSIVYKTQITPGFKMEISQDFKKVLFANKQENYILETSVDKSGQVKTSVILLRQLDGKIVRYICHDNNGKDFLLVACYEFDKQIEILSTKNHKFVINFPYAVEPNCLEIYDVTIRVLKDHSFKEKEEDWQKLVGDGQILMPKSCFRYELNFSGERDEGYLQSQAIFEMWEQKEASNPGKQAKKCFNVDKEKVYNYSIQKIQGFSVKWPYVAFQGLTNNYLMLINAYDRDETHRIKFPKEVDQILETFISETNDLFVMTQRQDIYEFWQIQLEEIEQANSNGTVDLRGVKFIDHMKSGYNPKKLFWYKAQDVEYKEMLKIYIRGVNKLKNEKLMVFIIHDGSIYSWKMEEGQQGSGQLLKNRSDGYICDTKSGQFNLLDEKTFFLLKEQRETWPIEWLGIQSKTKKKNSEELESFFEKFVSDKSTQAQMRKHFDNLKVYDQHQHLKDVKKRISEKTEEDIKKNEGGEKPAENKMVTDVKQGFTKGVSTITGTVSTITGLFNLKKDKREITIEDLKKWRDLLQQKNIDKSKIENEIPKEERNPYYFVKNEQLIKPFSRFGKINSQNITRYTINFNDFEEKIIHSQNSSQENILNFKVDQEAQKLLVVSEVHKLPKNQNLKVMIFDLKKVKIEYESKVGNDESYGRLKSGVFKLIMGHLYFNNDIIKIRYDLINQLSTNDHSFRQIFDSYKNVLILKDQEKVLFEYPKDSMSMHKMIYVTRSNNHEGGTRLIILPYLHEKRLYLTKEKIDTEYFYTSMLQEPPKDMLDEVKEKNLYEKISNQRSIACFNMSENIIKLFSQKGILRTQFDIDKIVKDGKLQCVSQNGVNYVFTRSSILKEKKEKIIQLKESQKIEENRTSLRVYQLSQYGLKQKVYIKDLFQTIIDLINHSDTCFQNIKKKVQNYKLVMGSQPKDVKEFKKFDVLLKYMRNSTDLQEKGMSYSINNHLDIIIKIDFKKIYDQCKSNQLNNQSNQDKVNFESSEIDYKMFIYFQNKELISHNHDKSVDEPETKRIKDLKPTFALISENEKPQKEADGKNLEVQQWQQTYSNCKVNSKEAYFKDQYNHSHFPEFTNYKMNENFIFFWNKSRIWSFSLKKKNDKHQLKEIPIWKSDKEGDEDVIQDVRVGGSKYIAIVIQQGKGWQHCVIIWNMEEDQQHEIIDVEGIFEIIWDEIGEAYIMQKNQMVFTTQGCSPNCFTIEKEIDRLQGKDFDNMIKKSKQRFQDGDQNQFGYEYGCRFDGQNHNWAMTNEYLNMSFSYMCFVIQEKIQNDEFSAEHDVFDYTPYNYIFNKSTAFIGLTFLLDDHRLFEDVLEKMYNENVTLIELIKYACIKNEENNDGKENLIKKQKIVSPLHQALSKGQNRQVDALLQYMALTHDNSNNMPIYLHDIMDDLVEKKNFILFTGQILFNTFRMQEKTSLTVSSMFSESRGIVQIRDSAVSYIDDQFFKHRFHEKKKQDLDKTKSAKQEKKNYQQKIAQQGNDVINSLQEELTYTTYPVNVNAIRIDWILKQTDESGNNSNGERFLSALYHCENISLFKEKSIILIIEYFYEKFSNMILKTFVPFNLVQLLFFLITVAYNEQKWDVMKAEKPFPIDIPADILDLSITGLGIQSQSIDEDVSFVTFNMKKNYDFSHLLGFINLILALAQLVLSSAEAYGMGYKQYLNRFWSYLEMVNLTLNFIFSFIMIIDTQKMDDVFDNKVLRVINSAQVLLHFFKQLYYLKLIETIANDIDIVFLIFAKIKTFTGIMLGSVAAFTISFYILGQNQLQFDQLMYSEAPPYGNFGDAAFYVQQLIMTGGDTGSFEIGKSPSTYYPLLFTYFFACYFLIIHMLNMLVAIMGEAFSENREQAEILQQRERLRFIIDKWFFKEAILYKSMWEFAFDSFFKKDNLKKFDQMNYIIAAFLEEELGIHGDQIGGLKTSIDQHKNKLIQFQGQSGSQMKDLKMDMEHLSREVININLVLQDEKNTQRETQEDVKHTLKGIKETQQSIDQINVRMINQSLGTNIKNLVQKKTMESTIQDLSKDVETLKDVLLDIQKMLKDKNK